MEFTVLSYQCGGYLLLSLFIFISAPVPSVVLTSEYPQVPSHPDYNTVVITCTDTLPLLSGNNQLQFDKQYNWTMNGSAIIEGTSGPTNPRFKESSATLEVDVTQVGVVTFGCTVTVSIPGDSELSDTDSISVNIIG